MDYDFPCEIQNIISLTFNFENLQKFLEFLDKKNRKAITQITELTLKFQEFSQIKDEIKEVNNRMDTLSTYQQETNQTQTFHSNKLLELEKKSTGLENVKKK